MRNASEDQASRSAFRPKRLFVTVAAALFVVVGANESSFASPAPSHTAGATRDNLASQTSASVSTAASPTFVDLTGTWKVDWIRRNFGGASQDVDQIYVLTVHRLDDSQCSTPSPCYQGDWYNPDAQRSEGSMTASAVLAGDRFVLTGNEPPDYSYNGWMFYTATSIPGITPLTFTGVCLQKAPADGTRYTDVTFTRQS